jgi:2-haloacid dehalogenase
MRYREILAEGLRRAAAREGIALPPGGEHALSERWAEMPIFDDVGPALGALRDAGWSLAILTNCDDDLIATTVARMPVEFDLLVTAEQVGSYKPAHGHWQRFAELTGERDAWVHAANSWVIDIKPASELGIPRVWVDRDRSGHDAAIADAVLPDLRDLPEAVSSLAS